MSPSSRVGRLHPGARRTKGRVTRGHTASHPGGKEAMDTPTYRMQDGAVESELPGKKGKKKPAVTSPEEVQHPTGRLDQPMWSFYSVTLQCRERLIGGYPKNPQTEEAMLRARGLEDLIPPVVVPTDPDAIEAAKAEAVERSWVGFKVNGENMPCLESRCVKAMFNWTR